jgi:hypothetical protein
MGDYTCHPPNQGWGGWYFVVAVGWDLLDALGFCFACGSDLVQPAAWGLLTTLFTGPLIDVFGMYVVMIARHTG